MSKLFKRQDKSVLIDFTRKQNELDKERIEAKSEPHTIPKRVQLKHAAFYLRIKHGKK